MSRLRPLLAALVLGVGLLTAVAGEPQPGPAADEVSARQLAEWLRAQRPGLQLLDLRPAQDHAVGRLPGARALPELDLATLASRDTLVVYTEGELEPALAEALRRRWRLPGLLRLHGGITAWNEEVMFPAIRADASQRERAAFAPRAQLSRYFGGVPRVLDPGASQPTQRSRRGC